MSPEKVLDKIKKCLALAASDGARATIGSELNQLAFNFAIPAANVRHSVVNQSTKSVRAAIESSMGEARILCEQWAKSATLEAWQVTCEFLELREQHSQSDDIRAEYALLRSIAADRSVKFSSREQEHHHVQEII